MSYSPFRHLGAVFRKSRPIQFTYFLTRRCNARCPACFYLSRDRDVITSEPELSLDEIHRVSRSLGSLLWLAFSGGEIFLREDLAEIVDVFYLNNKPALILLPTNGLLPERILEQTEVILRRCPKSTVVLKLSLDGLGRRHDALRGVPGAFRRVRECYGLLEGLADRFGNFELGINTLFCAENQDRMDEVIHYVKGLPAVRTHTVSLVRGAVSDPRLKHVDLRRYQAAAETLNSAAGNGRGSYGFRGGRLKTAQDILQRRLIRNTAETGTPQLPCFAGRLTLVLTETGDLYPCESFDRRLGNVRRDGYDLRRILRKPRVVDQIRAITETRCFCTHECYMMMNIFFNTALYPRLLREYMGLGGKRPEAAMEPQPKGRRVYRRENFSANCSVITGKP